MTEIRERHRGSSQARRCLASCLLLFKWAFHLGVMAQPHMIMGYFIHFKQALVYSGAPGDSRVSVEDKGRTHHRPTFPVAPVSLLLLLLLLLLLSSRAVVMVIAESWLVSSSRCTITTQLAGLQVTTVTESRVAHLRF